MSGLSQCFILYNWHTDHCHLYGGTYFTWQSLLLPSAPAIKKTYSPMGNSISHSTVRIILVPNVFKQYSAAAPLLKHRSTVQKVVIRFVHCCRYAALYYFWLSVICVIFSYCSTFKIHQNNDRNLYVSYMKQILSGFNSWTGRNIIGL